jgi:hypothetical protein
VVDPDRWLLGGVTDPKAMCMLLHSRSGVRIWCSTCITFQQLLTN